MGIDETIDYINWASTQVQDPDDDWESDFVKEIEQTKREIALEDMQKSLPNSDDGSNLKTEVKK